MAGFSHCVVMVRSSMRVGKAQGKTETQTLWLLGCVLRIDVLKVQCGHALCRFHVLLYWILLPCSASSCPSEVFPFRNAENNLLHTEHLGY